MVQVGLDHLMGKEGSGFKMIMANVPDDCFAHTQGSEMSWLFAVQSRALGDMRGDHCILSICNRRMPQMGHTT